MLNTIKPVHASSCCGFNEWYLYKYSKVINRQESSGYFLSKWLCLKNASRLMTLSYGKGRLLRREVNPILEVEYESNILGASGFIKISESK